MADSAYGGDIQSIRIDPPGQYPHTNEYVSRAQVIFHHAVSAIVCACALLPYFHYYAVFYVGPPEVSAVFLCPVDIFKILPSVKERNPIANFVWRVLFAVTYFIFRIGLWPVVTVHFVKDTLQALSVHETQYPIMAVLAMITFIPLTALQFYWGWLIIQMGSRTATALWKKEGSPSSSPLADLEGQEDQSLLRGTDMDPIIPGN